jgi:hypothetical protein
MNRKVIAKIAGFLVIFVILLEIFCVIFDGGYWFEKKFIYDRNARMAAFELEPKGQIDLLNVGDSLSTSALAPLELYRDYGITSYNLGQDLQTPTESFLAIETALKTQPIKVVLFEGHNLFQRLDEYEFEITLLSDSMRAIFPFFRFHYVWLKYWKDRSIRKYWKGFLVNDGHDPYTDGEYYDWGSEERRAMNKNYKMMFEQTVKLCKRKGIKLVLYCAPSPACYDISYHNTLSDLAKEYGIDFLDANYDRDKIEMDWKADTHDCGDHLNLSGSRRMTTYLASYLTENCDLPDHRGEAEYQAWADLWEPYQENIKEMEGTYYGILEDWLGMNY